MSARRNTLWSTRPRARFLLKRFVDVFGSLVGSVLFLPVMMLLAMLIRLESPGPVLFRQIRRGYRGEQFRILKFRTMTTDAERQLPDLERLLESDGGILFNLRADPRVTRLGSFLRRHHLDELPQFINVLRGEMSLVGPRPLHLRDSELLSRFDLDGYMRRLQVLPGITGPWQVSDRRSLNEKHMIEIDLDYVENWSLTWDLWIICKTLFVGLFPTQP